MDDNRKIRLWFQVFLTGCMYLIYIWISSLGAALFGVGIKHLGVLRVGLLFILPLSFALPRLMDLVSTLSAFLIYGPGYSDPSYENRCYKDDMDRAKRLVREGEVNGAIRAYREIARKAPTKYEARFNLAQVYRMAGYLGLALYEYDRLRNLSDELGPNHVFVRESERIIEELRGTLPRKQV
ncbi:MAG: hypothetical protein GTO13_19255 [Proteobacteria bacterium]|nr:hypothetical protein [Pseudomonadota bacterium]